MHVPTFALPVTIRKRLVEKIIALLTIENIGRVIFGIFAFCVAVQLGYFLIRFTRLAFFKEKSAERKPPPVSIIICARNELQNLKEYLHQVLEQDYPEFQVIVVNDCSWDESEKYLEELEEKHRHLKVVTLAEQERYQHGKKFALAIGIKSALHEHLLLTDADCYPQSNQWIKQMMSGYQQETQIVVGYGAYIKQKSVINSWVRFDTAFNAMQYLSFAIARRPYMGVGRNLSYTKSLFFKNKGFASHQHIMSGDDDLFINETANASNTEVCLSSGSFTFSQPKTNFVDWFKQKKRHVSASKLYKSKHKFALGLFFTTHIFLYISLIALLIIKFKIVWVVSAYGLRLVTQLFIFGKCLQRLKETDLIWLIPVYDLMIAIVYPFIALSNLVIKNKTWK